MHCPACQFDNPDGMQFCIECGASLARACPNCGASVVPHAKFCGQCGQALKRPTAATADSPGRGTPVYKNQATATSQQVAPERPIATMDRRHLTVMFCDLVGSTRLAASLDPEDLHQAVCAYQEVCGRVIERYGGYVAQYLGDGVLVYFGYPSAHEDDAQRAVRTGLGILAELQGLNTRLRKEIPAMQDQSVQVRIGIHTGFVVVGELGLMDKRERLAMGDTPNLAARLQEAAEPGTVVVSAATYRLVEGYFACQPLPPSEMKGYLQAMQVYRVLAESGLQNRFEIAVTEGLTPMVGRHEQIELLCKSWEYAKDGYGQVVLLRGEAGVGKSRLVRVTKETVVGRSGRRIDCCCSPYYQNTALYPIIELVQRALGLAREDTPEDKLRKLESALEVYRSTMPELVPVLASLLSLPQPSRGQALLDLTPQQLKVKTQEALLAWLHMQIRQMPVLVVFEDLQWADPTTLELLSLLLDQVPMSRLLLMFTFRSEFSPPWAAREHMVSISVNRLPPALASELVSNVTNGKRLPDEVLAQIVRKTDGVPLFVEELTKMVLGSGLLTEVEGHYELNGSLPPLAIPTTLQDSLMARLDRLAAVKEVAQLGAALGREFSYELLHAIAAMPEPELQAALAKLVEAEVLYLHGLQQHTRYIFKHALIQDAAYQALTKGQRQHYHQKIAQVLEAQFQDMCESQPELLAHHCTEAGLIPQAIAYWQQAGEFAVSRSANAEGVAHLSKGLELTRALPDNAERAKLEIRLCVALGIAYMSTRGAAAPEVGEIFQRAYALCAQAGDTPDVFRVLRGLSRYYLVRGETNTALACGQKLFGYAQHIDHSALHLGAHYVIGCALFMQGKFAESNAHFAQGVAIYDPVQHRVPPVVYEPFDTGVGCFAFGAHVLWYLGFPDQALERMAVALRFAEDLGHPYSLAAAQALAAWLHMMRGEAGATLTLTTSQLSLSGERGFSLYVGMGTMLHGWALIQHGQRDAGITEIRQGLIAYRATGGLMGLPFTLGVLAENLSEDANDAEALSLISEGLQVVERNGERFGEALLYRLKGNMLLRDRNADPSEGEQCLLVALETAQAQAARSLELRIVLSLARLWHQRGETARAHKVLQTVYDTFTEGFETGDLREARALLNELS